MTIIPIQINLLVKSPLNVRRTSGSKADMEELKASILAHGLMQNLVVTDAGDGNYHVIAGARRLEALQALIAEGKLADDTTVPCQVVTEEQAVEMSLAENTVRLAMHPADEFEAFVVLADQGHTASQIGERFGKTEKHVLQRLKLGRVAPELIAEYRAGEITLEALEAFTVTDDRERQVEVYRSLNSWSKDNTREIRSRLTESLTSGKSKLAKFVTLEAYEAAGGETRTDLFGEDVYLEDTALLQRLAGEKLEAEAEKLRADGWGWVMVDFDDDYTLTRRCGRIEPQPLDAPAELLAELAAAEADQTRIASLIDAAYEDDEPDVKVVEELEEQDTAVGERIEGIERKLEAYVDYLPMEKKLAGCFVSIDFHGKLDIEKGLVKPEDKKAVQSAHPEGGEPEETPDDKPGLSQALIDDLKRYRTQVAQVAIAENPAIAFDLLVFNAARSKLGNGHVFDGPQVSFQNQYLKPSVEAKNLATMQMEAIKKALSLAWLKEKTEPAQFAAFRELADEDKHRLLAYCTAMTLQTKLAPGEGKQKTAYDTALSLTGVNVAEYWRPTAANFLGRITKPQLLEIGRELVGGERGDHWASVNGKEKKRDIADELHRHFEARDGAASPTATPEQIERLRNWLPVGMAIATTEQEPTPAKAKKANKAA